MNGARKLAGWLGAVGLACLPIAIALQVWAEAHGVHCPVCDRPPDRASWDAVFSARDALVVTAFAGGAIGLIATRGPRRWLGLASMAAALACLAGLPA